MELDWSCTPSNYEMFPNQLNKMGTFRMLLRGFTQPSHRDCCSESVHAKRQDGSPMAARRRKAADAVDGTASGTEVDRVDMASSDRNRFAPSPVFPLQRRGKTGPCVAI